MRSKFYFFTSRKDKNTMVQVINTIRAKVVKIIKKFMAACNGLKIYFTRTNYVYCNRKEVGKSSEGLGH